MEVKELAEALLRAKAVERKANAERIAAEEALIAALGKRDEGSKTHTIDGYKVTITGKVSRKMDWKAWAEIEQSIPVHLRPVKMKPELDEKGVKYLQANEPEIYKLLPLSVSPAKTAVDVEITDKA
jgi:hypothetical protein